MLLAAAGAGADPVSLDSWFQGPRLVDVTLSPDAKSLLMIAIDGEQSYVLVKDRSTGATRPIFATDPKQDISPRFCGWVSGKRIVCRFSGHTGKRGDGDLVSRLVAMDSDGGNQRNLLTGGASFNQNYVNGNDSFGITSWRSDEPDTLVVTGWLPGSKGYGAAKLNAGNSILRVIARPQDAITVFQDDGAGNVLLAGGVPPTLSRDKKVTVFGRASNEAEWKLLKRLASHSDDPHVALAGVIPGTQSAYMVMTREGRRALFKIDLADQKDPEAVYWHETRDIFGPMFDSRQRLLGVAFATSLMGPDYIDARAAAINGALQKSFPNRFNFIEDVSEDGKIFLIKTASVSEPDGYYVLDASQGKVNFDALGSAWPGLAKQKLPLTAGVGISTRSGNVRESLFTAPEGVSGKVPLVVFADGTQTTGGFEPATYFLVSRGYAVLRSYFPGRSAEDNWVHRPYLDWNGALYEDLVDAVRWAAQRPEVDATRVCSVGRNGFGGFQALLAAAREGGPFKCAASLEGYSDLAKPRADVEKASLIEDERPTGTSAEQVAKESPLRRAAEFRVPVLLIEGDTRTHSARDYEDGREMAAALARANKPHQLVLIDEIDDPYTRAAYTALEKFLAQNLR